MSGKRGMLGTVVGLVGAALTGWALFTMFSSSSCVRTGAWEVACGGPGLTGPALIAGFILAVIGMCMGGGMIVFSALFLAIGAAGLAVGALGLMPIMPGFGWLFGGIFFLCGLIPLFFVFAMRRVGAAKIAQAVELMESGAKGIGTIVNVSDTGMTINDNPRVLIRMRVEPVDGSAMIERDKTVTVSRVEIPRVGDRYPVWFDRADPEKWMFATEMMPGAPAEARELFARAKAGAGPSSFASGAAAEQAEAGPVEELARLTGLWKDGALTDSEFADAKARLLPRIGG